MIQTWLADCEDSVPLPRIGLGYPWLKKVAEHVWSKGMLPERIEGWVRYGPILDADWPAGTLAFRKVKLVCKVDEEAKRCKS